jgi:AsmA-like protein
MTFKKWLRAILIAGVLLFGASFGFSRALRGSAARRYLIAHLTATFGRPVEVSWFDFSLLGGARIQAHLVSVSEDPHFGNEYFLRADMLTAGPRWGALLAGRLELGSVSLLRPSLNLVRDADGHWNIERWLPPVSPPGARPGFVGPVAPSSDARAARLGRIDVNGGRINFKQQDNKIPFALAGVSGRVEQDGAGRWQLDLEARPMRAGVELQDIGTLRLRGRIAGTTARLQPADLHLNWRAASLADALRLARQNDYGMRGELAVDLDARVSSPEPSVIYNSDPAGSQWTVSGVARLTGIHGWRLPERSSDPTANFAVEMTWRLGTARAEIQKFIMELPASRLQGAGKLEWSHGLYPQLEVEPSTVALADILAWYRALRPGIAEDLRAEGVLGMELSLGGWPMQLQQGAIAGVGASLTAKSMPAPLRIGALNASVSHGGLDLAPAEISFVSEPPGSADAASAAARASPESFVLRGSILPDTGGVFHWPPNWSVSVEGSASRVQDWLSLSELLGQQINSGWTAEGGLAVKVRGLHRMEAPVASWLGSVDLHGMNLKLAFINQPVRLPKAHVEFAPLQRTFTLTGAEAFGAVWHGSIARKSSDAQWTFDLSADRLDIADLDRWLGPRARQGFLARFAGLQPAPAAITSPDGIAMQIKARGHLRAEEIELAPLHLEEFDGQTEISGRTIRVQKGQADFFGGKVSGSFSAQLLPDPWYEFKGQFEKVNLSQVGRAVTFLNNRIGGNLSASLGLSAHGIGHPNLMGSMEGAGTLNGRNIELRGLDLSHVFPSDPPGSAPILFSSVEGSYRIRAGGIDLANFILDHSKEQLEAEGRIDFGHALNIRIRPLIFQAASDPPSASPLDFLLGGTIETPKLVPPPSVSRPPTQPTSRQR